jgi:HK97 family phage major capsid protein
MSDMQEIKGLVEKINPVLAELRGEVDAIKTRDGMDNEKFDKMTASILADMQKMQDTQAKIKAAMDRPGTKSEQADELEAKSAGAFADYMRNGHLPDGVKFSETDGLEIRAMSTDNNLDGGYLVRPSFSNMIVTRIFETSPMRQLANVESTGSKSVEMLIDDQEAGARWAGEGASEGETDTPQLALKEIAAHKIEADPRASSEQIQDSYLNVENWLGGKVADKFGRTQNTAFLIGNGVAKPRGLLTYAAWASTGVYERNKIEQVNSGSGTTVTADGLIDLQNSLKEGYQGNATFAMKRATFGEVLKLKGSDAFYFSPTLLRDGQSALQLLGKNVVFMDDVPAVGAGLLSVVYGDFRTAYTIIDRVGIQVIRDIYTNKGFITFYTTQRVGGDVTNFDAIKIGKCAA